MHRRRHGGRSAPRAGLILSRRHSALSSARIGAACAALLITVTAAATPRIARYHVRLALDTTQHTVRGDALLELATPATTDELLVFERNALVVDRLEIDGRRVAPGASPLTVRVPADARRIRVTYHGSPGDGIRFGTDFVYTGFATCSWMPCRDDPSERAVFELELEAPSGFRTVSSGPSARPPYLFGFATGRYAEVTRQHGAVKLTVLSSLSKPLVGHVLDETARMLDFFAERAGVPYPGATYTQVVVDGEEAQEKDGFSIIGRAELEPVFTAEQEDWVIAHELAHMWWGNVVGCRTWSDLWLDEGLVSYLVAAWKEMRWGRAAYVHELALLRRRHAAAVSTWRDVPLGYAGAYPSLREKRAFVYAKGALFFAALRERVGDAAFWQGLRTFTREHAGGTVATADLQRAMEQAAGCSLASTFDPWFRGAAPSVRVE